MRREAEVTLGSERRTPGLKGGLTQSPQQRHSGHSRAGELELGELFTDALPQSLGRVESWVIYLLAQALILGDSMVEFLVQ